MMFIPSLVENRFILGGFRVISFVLNSSSLVNMPKIDVSMLVLDYTNREALAKIFPCLVCICQNKLSKGASSV